MNYDYLRSGLGKLDLTQRKYLSDLSSEISKANRDDDAKASHEMALTLSAYVYAIRDSGIISAEERAAIAEWFSRNARDAGEITSMTN